MKCYFIGGQWDGRLIDLDADKYETFEVASVKRADCAAELYVRYRVVDPDTDLMYYIFASRNMKECQITKRAKELLPGGSDYFV